MGARDLPWGASTAGPVLKQSVVGCRWTSNDLNTAVDGACPHPHVQFEPVVASCALVFLQH